MYKSMSSIVREVLNKKSELGEKTSEMSIIKKIMGTTLSHNYHLLSMRHRDKFDIKHSHPIDKENEEGAMEHNREVRTEFEKPRRYQHNVNKKVSEED